MMTSETTSEKQHFFEKETDAHKNTLNMQLPINRPRIMCVCVCVYESLSRDSTVKVYGVIHRQWRLHARVGGGAQAPQIVARPQI